MRKCNRCQQTYIGFSRTTAYEICRACVGEEYDINTDRMTTAMLRNLAKDEK